MYAGSFFVISWNNLFLEADVACLIVTTHHTGARRVSHIVHTAPVLTDEKAGRVPGMFS